MAEEKTVTTTAVETGEKPEAAEGTTQEKPEAVAKTYDQAYVDDLIEGMVRMMASPADFLGPVNLGNPHEFTILELAEKVIRLTGSRSKIAFRELPHDDPRQRQPDITLAREKLDYDPSTQLEEGLKHTIEYFRSLN